MEEQKYTEKDLTDDEKMQSQFNKDSIELNLETATFDLGMMQRQADKNIPQRQAGLAAKEEIRKKKIEIKQMEEQLKMYSRRVRTGKKKVPVMNNTPAPEELAEPVKPEETTKE